MRNWRDFCRGALALAAVLLLLDAAEGAATAAGAERAQVAWFNVPGMT